MFNTTANLDSPKPQAGSYAEALSHATESVSNYVRSSGIELENEDTISQATKAIALFFYNIRNIQDPNRSQEGLRLLRRAVRTEPESLSNEPERLVRKIIDVTFTDKTARQILQEAFTIEKLPEETILRHIISASTRQRCVNIVNSAIRNLENDELLYLAIQILKKDILFLDDSRHYKKYSNRENPNTFSQLVQIVSFPEGPEFWPFLFTNEFSGLAGDSLARRTFENITTNSNYGLFINQLNNSDRMKALLQYQARLTKT